MSFMTSGDVFRCPWWGMGHRVCFSYHRAIIPLVEVWIFGTIWPKHLWLPAETASTSPSLGEIEGSQRVGYWSVRGLCGFGEDYTGSELTRKIRAVFLANACFFKLCTNSRNDHVLRCCIRILSQNFPLPLVTSRFLSPQKTLLRYFLHRFCWLPTSHSKVALLRITYPQPSGKTSTQTYLEDHPI